MSKFGQTQFIVKQGDGVVELKIIGRIDESTDFQLLKIEPAPCFILDLGEVSGMNSMGLRAWLKWIQLISKNAVIKFRACPTNVIDQMNVLQGFLPVNSVVESFYVPYFCSGCEHHDFVLLQRGKDYMEATADAPFSIQVQKVKTCSNCQESSELDIIPSKFYLFLQRQRR